MLYDSMYLLGKGFGNVGITTALRREKKKIIRAEGFQAQGMVRTNSHLTREKLQNSHVTQQTMAIGFSNAQGYCFKNKTESAKRG